MLQVLLEADKERKGHVAGEIEAELRDQYHRDCQIMALLQRSVQAVIDGEVTIRFQGEVSLQNYQP